jgi:HPt (histidine-containing phosphotransfer) domain-containing protein
VSSAVEWATLEGIAREYDRDLADQLVALFLAELPDRIAALTLGAAAGSTVVRDAAHTLGSTSLTIGAARLGQLCRDLEREWAEPAQVRALVPAVLAEADRVSCALREDYAGSNR